MDNRTLLMAVNNVMNKVEAMAMAFEKLRVEHEELRKDFDALSGWKEYNGEEGR